MPREHDYFVYILTNRSRSLYIGVTNNLRVRVKQHREGVFDAYTTRYQLKRRVYYEHTQYVVNAIAREKQLKGWLRSRKIELIESLNPTWEDLYPKISGE